MHWRASDPVLLYWWQRIGSYLPWGFWEGSASTCYCFSNNLCLFHSIFWMYCWLTIHRSTIALRNGSPGFMKNGASKVKHTVQSTIPCWTLPKKSCSMSIMVQNSMASIVNGLRRKYRPMLLSKDLLFNVALQENSEQIETTAMGSTWHLIEMTQMLQGINNIKVTSHL